MLPYIFLFFLTLAFMMTDHKFIGVKCVKCVESRFHYNPLSFSLFITVVFVLLLFTAVRNDVGWDYHSYYEAIAYSVDNNVISRGEFFTVNLVKLARLLNSPAFYFSANAFIFYLFFSIAIYRSKVNPFFCLLIFISFPLFFINSLSVVRTFTALSVIFYAVTYLENKRYIKFYFFVFIAACFHNSAFLALIYPFVSNLNIKSYQMLLVWFSSFFLISFVDFSAFGSLGVLSFYLRPSEVQEGTKAIYFFSVILIFLLFFRREFCNSNLFYSARMSQIYFNLYFFGVVVYSIFLSFGTMGHRLSLYGTFFSILITPKLVFMIRPYWFRYLTIFFFLFFLFLLYILSLNAARVAIMPYKTVIF
jgi:hypothetical protein